MGRTSSTINLLAGIWLVIAPFALNYAGLGASTTNDVILGIVIGILALIRLGSPSQVWASWLMMIAGLWLIISPFVLGYSSMGTVVANDVILGIIVGVFAIASTSTSSIESPRGI